MPNGFGKYDVYATTESIYCYPGSKVLRNRFGIRNQEKLSTVEADITTIRQYDLLLQPITGRFTANHLCTIHRYLFGDIYRFAGQYRRESIAKGQTIFENPQNIKRKLNTLLSQLKDEVYLRHMEEDIFIMRLAHYFAELNFIHPFREGNGRAIREFIRQLLLVNSYLVDWSCVSVDTLHNAMTESVYDTANLINVLTICLSPTLHMTEQTGVVAEMERDMFIHQGQEEVDDDLEMLE